MESTFKHEQQGMKCETSKILHSFWVKRRRDWLTHFFRNVKDTQHTLFEMLTDPTEVPMKKVS